MKLCPRNAKGQCLAHGAGRNGKKANAVLLRVSHSAKHCPELAFCIKSGFRLQAYFRTVRRGDAPGGRRGSGGCRQPCSTMQGSPPHSAILFRANSVSSTNRILASNHGNQTSSCRFPVAAVTVTAWHLARRPSIAPPIHPSNHCQKDLSLSCAAQDRPWTDRRLAVFSTHAHTHTCGVSLYLIPQTRPPPLYTDIGHRPEHGAKEGREGGRGRGNKIARLSIWFFSSTRTRNRSCTRTRPWHELVGSVDRTTKHIPARPRLLASPRLSPWPECCLHIDCHVAALTGPRRSPERKPALDRHVMVMAMASTASPQPRIRDSSAYNDRLVLVLVPMTASCTSGSRGRHGDGPRGAVLWTGIASNLRTHTHNTGTAERPWTTLPRQPGQRGQWSIASSPPTRAILADSRQTLCADDDADTRRAAAREGGGSRAVPGNPQTKLPSAKLPADFRLLFSWQPTA